MNPTHHYYFFKGGFQINFKFKFYNLDEEFKDCLEVNSAKTEDIIRNGSVQLGLFSEIVFGTLTDYQCKCGKYKGISHLGKRCEKCSVVVESSSVRRTRFGKIKLNNGYLLNPMIFDLILNSYVTSKNIKAEAYDILNGKLSIDVSDGTISKIHAFFDENEEKKLTEEEIKQRLETFTLEDGILTGPMAIKEYYINKILDNIFEKELTDFEKNKLNELMDSLYTQTIPVIPPDLRPMASATSASNFLDEINVHYMIIISMVRFLNDSPTVQISKLAILQKKFKILFDKLLQKLSRKSGLMRRNILGKRVDYSGRAVIVPDPTLNLQEIDLSFHIIKEIFKPQLLPRLAQKLKITELETLSTKYDSEECEDILFDLCDEYKGYPIILNRQPTLHRPSILVFTIRNIIKDYVIAIPPVGTEPYNADFDGDQVAVYAPIGSAAFNESLSLLPQKNMYLPSNGKLAFTFCEDLILGIYKLSLTEEGQNEILSYIPTEYENELIEYFDGGLTGKKLHKFLNHIGDFVSNKEFYEIINNLSHLGHNAADIAVSIVDFENAKKENLNNPVTLMIEAGARGKWGQIDQIRKSRGFVSDVEGKVIPNAIESSLLNGLTEDEFFTSCYGSIKGLIDTAKNTALSGYLTRRLVYLTSHIVLDSKLDDCGTNGFININITENNKETYLYRFIILDDNSLLELTRENIDDFVGKNVKMRSPLKCKAEGNKICHKCYGRLYKKHTSRQIGYIASQSLGERSTQLTLKTKHTSGATNIDLQDWIHIKDGIIYTDIPVMIQVFGDTILISDHEESDVVEFPNSTIKLTTTNYSEVEADDIDEDMVDECLAIKYIVYSTGKIGKISIRSNDIVTAISEFSTFIRSMSSKVEGKSIEEILKMFTDNFGFNDLASVQYEILLSVFCRRAINPQDLHRHYQDEPMTWFKESEVIASMPMQSLVFEKFSQKLPKVLLMNQDNIKETNNILVQMITFEFGDKLIYEADGSVIGMS